MEKEPMNSINNIVIQTALRPMTVFIQQANDSNVSIVADFSEFFAALQHVEITPETQIYIDRGPGSYAGIRSGIAYVYGLLHGGLIKQDQIHSFTTFQLVSALSGKEATFIKSWPRIPNGTLDGSKGYFNDVDVQSFIDITELKQSADIAIYSEENLKELPPYTYLTSEILNTPDTYLKLINFLQTLQTNTLEPLYINPVHIN